MSKPSEISGEPPEAGPTPPVSLPAAKPVRESSARRWLIRLAVLAVLAASGYTLKITVFAPDPVEVRVVAVELGQVEATVTNSRAGTVRARHRAGLSPEASGRVVALPHREGARVEKGDLLLSLSDASQRARLLVAKRAHEASEALLREANTRNRRAEQALQRGLKLARDGLVTADDVERLESANTVALASCDTAVARVAQAKAEVTLAKAELAKCALLAPFSGILAEVSTELGEWITPAPPMTLVPDVIDMIDPTSIYVSAPMDEVDSAVVRSGLAARVTLDPLPGQSFKARVTRVAAYVLDVEAQNRTVEIEVELEDAELAANLLPGTSADVEVILETRVNVLRIPAPALLDGDRVFVLEGGLLTLRKIETGLKNWDYVEVLSGLREGEEVVTSLGKQEVQPGVEAVRLVEDE